MRSVKTVIKSCSQWMVGIIVLMLMAGNVLAAQPLPQDDAFSVSATVTDARSIITSWKVAPGYHLFADKLKISIEPNVPFKTALPETHMFRDPVSGMVPGYEGNFIIPVETKSDLSRFKLTVSYQGCSSEGFCYPPTRKTFEMVYAGTVGGNTGPDVTNVIDTNQGITALLTDQYGVQNLLAKEQRSFLLFIFLGLGILLAFTPCVLPMLPILTGIIAGQKKSSSELKIFFLSLVYVLGMAITYAFAGMLAALAGNSLQVWLQTPVVIMISAGIFVLLAFSLFEFYELPLSRRWQTLVTNWSRNHEGGTFVGVFFMGVLSTLIVSPCVTAPLVGVLLYISRTGDMLIGGSALFAMGLGMGIPLLILGMSLGHWLPKSGKWMHVITKSFGVLMLGMAIWLLGRILPMSVMLVLYGLYLLGIAMFFSLYLTRVIGRHHINHTLGFVSGLIGVLMIISTIGTPALVDRWTGGIGGKSAVYATDFAVVYNLQELEKSLAEAKANKKPALVDFYADWCSSCIEMDTQVFSQSKVQGALQPFKLIRVDLTANSNENQAIMQRYGVIAPPTVIFFNMSGDEVGSKRIVGELSARSFLNRIHVFINNSCDQKAQC